MTSNSYQSAAVAASFLMPSAVVAAVGLFGQVRPDSVQLLLATGNSPIVTRPAADSQPCSRTLADVIWAADATRDGSNRRYASRRLPGIELSRTSKLPALP